MAYKGFKKAPMRAAEGTALMGKIKTSYAKIVSRFGRPTKGFDKTDAEWVLRTPSGRIAVIYNWKNGKNYLGKRGTPVSQIKVWHIGGRSSIVVREIQEVL